MHANYKDICELIDFKPVWFDECAVPRYCKFSPKRAANIYAKQVVLLRIRCQGCQHRFDVCMSWSQKDSVMYGIHPLEKQISEGSIHYGDPPNIGCCPAGPTMNSEPVRVLQYWTANKFGDWRRDQDMEVDIPCDWMEDNET